MPTAYLRRALPALLLVSFALPRLSTANLILGEPPRAPQDVAGLPGGTPTIKSATGGFTVTTDSREQVRSFFNAIYPASDNVPIDTTADVANCIPGTNSPAFQDAVLRRINWFRAMGGVPAVIALNASNNVYNQQGAVMMSANDNLSHFPPTSWSCYTGGGAHAASNSNIALGSDGADSITGYIWDFGANNSEVGHRRWLLYPQTQVMGTGDVPAAGSYNAANTTWVFDANLFGPRPATRQPYVCWPPEGFVPYQVVYPQWSFALSNANLSASTVAMTSNGVSVAVSLQPYTNGYGENTLVWVPMGLDPTTESSVFPFNGNDTVYNVTVSNIKVGTSSFSISYHVTLFDPAVAGPDYVAPVISGPSQPIASMTNLYFCQSVNNSNATSYQWRVSTRAAGNLSDDVQNGLVNFTMTPAPDYPIITNSFDGLGNCFHLAHPDTSELTPQLLQLNEVLFPRANTVASFSSMLGFATTGETARAQVSTDGGVTWRDVYTLAGANIEVETSFNQHSLPLSNYAGQAVLLRFNYDFSGGNYYPGALNYVGWCIRNLVITNTDQLTGSVIYTTGSTNFDWDPGQTGGFTLEARAVIFTDSPLEWGPVDQVTVISNALAQVLTLSAPVLANNQVLLDFAVNSGPSGKFKLLQVDQLGAAWTTNTSAVLSTNIPGSSYRFTTTNGALTRFFRVIETP
ncbi:MAG TPA: CAP domain-containing protein [Verrucomicrobiae bacterium]|nr:CAP domain-containing protein [Verrucomicrobiae bacterium]